MTDAALMAQYMAVKENLDRLDFESLWPGFSTFPFALYTSERVCVGGEMVAWDDRFRGNTAIKWEDGFLAIWYVTDEEDAEPLAASMAHEMFHAYQYSQGETRFPNDLTMLMYPDDADHFAVKLEENKLLCRAAADADKEALAAFVSMRKLRMRLYPDAVAQELRAETIEGLATYVEWKALRTFRAQSWEASMAKAVEQVNTVSDAWFAIRRQSYWTGVLLAVALEACGYPVYHPIAGETRTVFELAEEAVLRDAPMTASLSRNVAEKKAAFETAITIP